MSRAPSSLRRKAEAIVAQRAEPAPAAGEKDKVLHELLVHQVELELQNEELRRLQDSLEASRERYFNLFDLAPVGYLVLGESGVILEANLTAASQLGVPRAELVDAPFSRWINPEDQDIFYLAGRTLLTTEEVQICRLRLLKSDGSPLWVRLEAAVSRAKDTPAVMRVSISDISEAVRATEDLVQREQEYRLLAENASDVVMRCSPSGLVEWITPSVLAMANWPPEDIVGRPFRDLVHPDDWSRLDVASEQLNQGIGFALELRIHIRRNGWKWFAVHLGAALDDRGKLVHHVGGWHDIQTEVQSRQALLAERARLRATLDSLLDPHAVLGAVRDDSGEVADFLVTDANEATGEFLGLPRSEVVGRRLLELFTPRSAELLLEVCRGAAGSGLPLVVNDFALPFGGPARIRRFDLRAVCHAGSLNLTWRDVTERWLAAEKLASSDEQYRMLALNVTDVVIHLSAKGKVLWVSPSLTNMLGWDCSEWTGQGLAGFFADAAEARSLMAALRTVEADSRPLLVRARMRAKGGGVHWIAISGSVYRNAAGEVDGFTASLRTIDKEVEFEQDLERRARTDQLTNLLNREAALTQLSRLRKSEARSGRAIAVLFCDLDNLKTINDTRGHAVGDEVLRVTADRLLSCLRGSDDLGARVGGDEMLVVLRGVGDLADALAVAEKLRFSVAEPIAISGEAPVHASMSIGVALARPRESTAQLIARADRAMYESKQAGRNRVIAIAGDREPKSPAADSGAGRGGFSVRSGTGRSRKKPS
jgi:diguanylate cyclase (GGDEF)-like protein/PAS domain S-box-containing protein